MKNTIELIKQKARELGFSAAGIARAEKLDREKEQLDQWLDRHMHGTMSYMERLTALRVDPEQLLTGAKSVISLAYNYHNPEYARNINTFRISQYAYGRDYHKVLRKKLKRLTEWMVVQFPDIKTRICIDSAPIMEKAWAMRAGIGWIGKNGCLILPEMGSFFFLGEIITDLALPYDHPESDHCAECRLCIDACPTDAIVEPYKIDSRRCIPYLTIEHKGPLPEDMHHSYKRWIFGCDICQDICPFNHQAQRHSEPDFEPPVGLLSMDKHDWQELTEEKFKNLFRGSAVKRTGYSGLKRNIDFVS